MTESESREAATSTPAPPQVRQMPVSSSLRNRINAGTPAVDAAGATPAGAGTALLSCQWCSVQLAPGVSICPTCGSPGVPNADLRVPGSERLQEEVPAVQLKAPDELVEWWRDDEADADGAPRGNVYRNSSAARDSDPLMTVAALGGAVVVCVALGILAAPLLAPLMENITGVEVENVNDLRPMGGIVGLLTGLFVGAILSWVVQPRR